MEDAARHGCAEGHTGTRMRWQGDLAAVRRRMRMWMRGVCRGRDPPDRSFDSVHHEGRVHHGERTPWRAYAMCRIESTWEGRLDLGGQSDLGGELGRIRWLVCTER